MIEHTILSDEDNTIATHYVVEPNEDNSHEENDSEALKKFYETANELKRLADKIEKEPKRKKSISSWSGCSHASLPIA